MALEITDANFEETVLKSDKPVMVSDSSEQCPQYLAQLSPAQAAYCPVHTLSPYSGQSAALSSHVMLVAPSAVPSDRNQFFKALTSKYC